MAGKTIVALYDDFADAVHAVRALEEAGFQHEDLSLVANNTGQRWGEAHAARQSGTAEGSARTTGAGPGLLASLDSHAVPGVGPVLAAGPVAGAGAMEGGLVGGLGRMGLQENEAHAYAEGVRRGGALVSARVPADQAQRATGILQQHHPVDVEERREGWQRGGWRNFDPGAEPWTAESIEGERAQWRAQRAPAAEERAAGLRAGVIHQESETARMSGGPLLSAMSGMAGSAEGEQENAAAGSADEAGRTQAHEPPPHRDENEGSDESEGLSPGERVNRAMDRAAAGDKPMHADDPDRYGGKDPLAGRK
jgi:hypothetical protein